MKLRTLIVALALTLIATPASAQEKVALAAPQAPPAVTDYAIRYFAIDIENQRVLIELKANTGELKTVIYSDSAPVMGADAQGQPIVVTPSDRKASTMISAINSKVDMRVKSLERRIFERLIADGHLSGSVTGTPK